MANGKWRDVRMGVHGLNLGLKMDENFLDVLLGSRMFPEVEDLVFFVNQYSPIIVTKGHFISSPSATIFSEVTDDNFNLLSGIASISAATDTGTARVSEATSYGTVIVKELVVKVLPSTDAKDKGSKTFVVKNIPRSSMTCMPSFETYVPGRAAGREWQF